MVDTAKLGWESPVISSCGLSRQDESAAALVFAADESNTSGCAQKPQLPDLPPVSLSAQKTRLQRLSLVQVMVILWHQKNGFVRLISLYLSFLAYVTSSRSLYAFHLKKLDILCK